MDALTITREEFRLEMNKLLEFLSQGLGGVPGAYSNEAIDPLALLLAGAPKLLSTAIPPAADDSQRLPSTSWVQAVLAEWGKGRTFLRVKSTQTTVGAVTRADTTVQFNAPGTGGVIGNFPLQLSLVSLAPTDATGSAFWTWISPFASNPVVLVSANLTAVPAANLAVIAHVVESGPTTCKAAVRYISGASGPAAAANNTFHYLAFGPAVALIP